MLEDRYILGVVPWCCGIARAGTLSRAETSRTLGMSRGERVRSMGMSGTAVCVTRWSCDVSRPTARQVWWERTGHNAPL